MFNPIDTLIRLRGDKDYLKKLWYLNSHSEWTLGKNMALINGYPANT